MKRLIYIMLFLPLCGFGQGFLLNPYVIQAVSSCAFPEWNDTTYTQADIDEFMCALESLNYTQTNTTTTFDSLSGPSKWYGGVLAPNGKIYGIPFTSTTVLEIDPATNTTTTFGSLSGATKWSGGVLAPNGKIYGIPRNSTSVLEILTEIIGLPTNMPLSRHLNKL